MQTILRLRCEKKAGNNTSINASFKPVTSLLHASIHTFDLQMLVSGKDKIVQEDSVGITKVGWLGGMANAELDEEK